ncbi:MAG: translation elongation factor Ts [Alphaproteobacteria bacterium]|jgi:elongation factor Ts|nr:translation elongation factor Ts [Alphaproteobacteria bacterium]HJO88323.1 translation elongation factor Ts [Alphaproteobacteria bacterium]
MTEITASLVKELRDKTGAGMMNCKKALGEADGDLEAAIDWLRKKGMAAAAKKSGRVAVEGLIGIAVEGDVGALVEVNAETDFVSRNDVFQAYVRTVTGLALEKDDDLSSLLAGEYPESGRSVEEELTHLIATIGENMSFRRAARLQVEEGVMASYIHNSVVPGMGRIGVLVGLSSTGDKEKLSDLGKQVAMHVAAANPQSVSQDDLDPELVERERAILAEQARASGKPEEIIGKMVEGRLRKFFEEVALLDQIFVIDGENKVSQAIAEAAKDIGAEVTITGFVRFALGEGVERKEEDFATEVAAAAGA